MNVKVEKGELVIRIPLQEPAMSKTGKTLVVATSKGNKETTAICPKTGKPIIVGFNAYVRHD